MAAVRRARARRCRASPGRRRCFERKFYFDEAYDFAFYRPAVWVAKALVRWIEQPLVFGSVRELAEGIGLVGRDTSRIQTGLVRTYVFAIAASVAVVTSSSWLVR